jgi:hypothetical protein
VRTGSPPGITTHKNKKEPQKVTRSLLVRVAGVEPVHLSAQEPKCHATWQQYIEKIRKN